MKNLRFLAIPFLFLIALLCFTLVASASPASHCDLNSLSGTSGEGLTVPDPGSIPDSPLEVGQTPELGSAISGPVLVSPLDGAATVDHTIPFGWCNTVEGARRYLLQVDNNPDFSCPEIEAFPMESQFTPQVPLLDDTYYWRVRAIYSHGQSDWSEVWTITIFTPDGVGIQASNDVGIVSQWQHKDTMMLCLGGCPLIGTHAWDRDHVSRPCAHCDMYCGRASVSMINHYYGGNLSQDRISYRAWGGDAPEDDLRHGVGMWPHRNNALSWALNGAAENMILDKPTYAEIQGWIDAGRPILAVIPDPAETHCVVIDGYNTTGTLVNVVDPWTNAESQFDYTTYSIGRVYVPPAGSTGRNGEDVDTDGIRDTVDDSDGDGICDFDERERFNTSPTNPDTDGDDVPDKAEVRSYTFLSNDSFDAANTRLPDPDGDGFRAERDADSDNGGKNDGLEDFNHNGRVDAGETDPLNAADDDLTPPTVTVNSPNGGEAWKGGSSHNITWTANDNVGMPASPIYLYYSINNGSSWSTIVSGTSNDGSYTWSVPYADSNLCLVKVRAVDKASNWGEDVSNATFTIDSTPPTTTKSVGSPSYIDGSGNSWVNSSTPFTLNATDNLSGVSATSYRYYLIGTTPPSFTQGTSFAISGVDGQYTVEYYSVDNLGNTGWARAQEEWLDNTPPTTDKTVGTPQYTDGGKLWITSATPHSLSTTGDGSGCGVANIYYRHWRTGTGIPGWTTYTGAFYVDSNDGSDGQYQVEHRAADYLGNTLPSAQIEWLDNTPPTTTKIVGSPQYTDGGKLWVTWATPHTLIADDGSGCGVVSVIYRYWRTGSSTPGWKSYLSPFYINTNYVWDGEYQVEYRAADYLGNCEPANSQIEWLDNCPPSTSKTVGSPQHTDDLGRLWVTSATPHTLVGNDWTGSGVANTYYRYYLSGSPPPAFSPGTSFAISGVDGQYTVEYYSVDNLGNTGWARAQEEWLDNTPPVTTKTIGTPQYTDGGNLWVTSATPHTLRATDSGCGVDDIHYRYWRTGTGIPGWTTYTVPFYIDSYDGADGTYQVRFYSVDNLGNAETANSQEEWLDNTPPTTTKTVGTPQYTDSSGKLWVTSDTPHTLAADDGSGSGVAASYYRYYLTHGYDLTGTTPPPFTSGTGFTVMGADGQYGVEYYSVDNLGNTEATNSQTKGLDNSPPNSQVDSMLTYQLQVPFDVSYIATDAGSGVQEVELWYRYQAYTEAPWTGWARYDGSSPVSFSAPYGNGVYEFYTLAVDNLGNWETPPAVADASIRVIVTIPGRSVFFYDAARGTGLWLDYQAGEFQLFTPEKVYPVKSGYFVRRECDGSFSLIYCDCDIRLRGTFNLDTDTARFTFFDKATPSAWRGYHLYDPLSFESPY